jgi:hypothetical protein
MRNRLWALGLTATLAACGGGGGTSSTPDQTPSTSTLKIVPSLGRFADGSVKVLAADGTTITSGTISNGTANLSSSVGCVPVVIEVSNGNYYAEGTDSTENMGAYPLRAAIPCFNEKSDVGVSALTEMAFQKLGSSRDSKDISAANEYVRNLYAGDISSITIAPTLIGSKSEAQALAVTEAGKYSLKLAAYSALAAKYNQNTMKLVNEAAQKVASTGYIDGESAQSYNSTSFLSDYKTAVSEYASKNAQSLTDYASKDASVPTASAIPDIMKTTDFAQLMRLFIAIPKLGNVLISDISAAVAGSSYTNLACYKSDGRYDDSVLSTVYSTGKVNNCLTTSSLFPYGVTSAGKYGGSNSDYILNGLITTALVKNNEYLTGNLNINLDLKDGVTGKTFNVSGSAVDMGTVINRINSNNVRQPTWVSSDQTCAAYEYKNGTITIGSGAEQITISNFNVCGDDSSLQAGLNFISSRTIKYFVQGTGVAGRSFTNKTTPLVFTQGTDQLTTVSHIPYFVSGKLTYPTSATNSITIEAKDGAALITLVTATTTTSTTVPIKTLFDKPIY